MPRCAHYDDGTSDPENGMFSATAGTCLFDTRNWSEACKPKRCDDCPADTRHLTKQNVFDAHEQLDRDIGWY